MLGQSAQVLYYWMLLITIPSFCKSSNNETRSLSKTDIGGLDSPDQTASVIILSLFMRIEGGKAINKGHTVTTEDLKGKCHLC